MSLSLTDDDRALIATLNRGAWTRTFNPETDVDWAANTTRDEMLALYDAWSLLQGTIATESLSEEQRIRFVTYQHMNLMLITALFERTTLSNFEDLYDDDDDAGFQEFVTHFIKEESYHYLLFMRAIARLHADDNALVPLPRRHITAFLRVVLFMMRHIPSRRVRHGITFFFFRFAEEISLQAHTMAKRTIAREDAFIPKIWALHAVDEARHVAFDDLMLKKAALPGVLARVPAWLATPVCVFTSLLLNLNEVWAARTLGIPVRYWQLPALMRRTTAPFKLRVFSLIAKGLSR